MKIPDGLTLKATKLQMLMSWKCFITDILKAVMTIEQFESSGSHDSQRGEINSHYVLRVK